MKFFKKTTKTVSEKILHIIEMKTIIRTYPLLRIGKA